jgi:hypothetical protein
VDAEQQIVRFEYSNAFYGSCTIVARIVKKRTRFILDKGSLSTERHAVRRGKVSALLKMADTFLEQLLLKSRSLEDLGCPSQLRQRRRVEFTSEIADASV